MTSLFWVGRWVEDCGNKKGHSRLVGWPRWDFRFFCTRYKAKNRKTLEFLDFKNFGLLLAKFWPQPSWKVPKIYHIVLKVIFEHICECK